MAIQVQGFSGVVAEVGGTGFRALTVSQKPLEYGALGIYKKSFLSGTIAAGLVAGSEIGQWRWGDATRLGVLQKITIDGVSGSATAFAAGFGKIDLVPARSFSASGTGGTAGTLTGNNGKLRTSMGTMLLTDVRFITTAALGAGTKTLDTDPIATISLAFGILVSVQYLNPTILLGEDIGPMMPFVAAQNEGVAMRATVPATGTWQTGASFTWAEVTSY